MTTMVVSTQVNQPPAPYTDCDVKNLFYVSETTAAPHTLLSCEYQFEILSAQLLTVGAESILA